MLIACEPQTKHDVLSFFFDGVPDPAFEKKRLSDSLLKAREKPTEIVIAQKTEEKKYLHPPYADRSCDNCHQGKGSQKLREQPPELCNNCHDDFTKKFQVVHGPVVNGYCTTCHDPHSSKNEKLLVSPDQKLCLNCHDRNDIIKNDIHSDIGTTKCWDCHSPHGGTDRLMLR